MEATPSPLADPQRELVENLCSQLLFDGVSLLSLGQVNSSWRKLVRDQELWERLNAARFGSSADLPNLAPAQPASAIPGWCFFPGIDSSGNDCANPADAGGKLRPANLAARAEDLNALAFNTQGWVKSALLPFFRWNRYSFTPGVGLYVREEAVARSLGKALPPPLPPHAEPEARPPDFPGWVFYQLMDSPGGDIRHPATGEDNFMSSCDTLAELAEVASRLPNCVAFSTGGRLKHSIHPQVCWRCDGGPCSWRGMYVREDVVEARKLRRPQQGAVLDQCLRYFQLSKTRLLAARDVDVTWLNDTYLMRVPDPTPPRPAAAAATAAAAAAGLRRAEVVKLSHVCWLELNGRFKGVGPGRYRVTWVLRVARDCNVPELNFRISIDALRQLAGGLSASKELTGTADGPSAPGSGSGSGSGGAVPAIRSVLDSLVVGEQELMAHAGPSWYRQHAGRFEVPAGMAFDVEVKLWNHGPTWKRGLLFKELVLKREEEPDDDDEDVREEEQEEEGMGAGPSQGPLQDGDAGELDLWRREVRPAAWHFDDSDSDDSEDDEDVL